MKAECPYLKAGFLAASAVAAAAPAARKVAKVALTMLVEVVAGLMFDTVPSSLSFLRDLM